jgi:hypothetical protein
MRVEETEKQMKEVEVVTYSCNLCDKCNEEIVKDVYDAFECFITHKTGNTYPTVGSYEEQKVELCKKCSVELISLLKQNGYRVIDSEWDW